jgi:hypothetical protein
MRSPSADMSIPFAKRAACPRKLLLYIGYDLQ